jgi:hypothetical protein
MKIRWLFFDPQGLWSRLMEISHPGKMMAPEPYHVATILNMSKYLFKLNQSEATEQFRPNIEFFADSYLTKFSMPSLLYAVASSLLF